MPFNTNLVQENFDDDKNVIHHQPKTPKQPLQITQDTTESLQDDENVIHHQQTTQQQPSQIIQDQTESLQDTLINPLNTSTIADSNTLQVPSHDITENTNNLFNQESTSTLSTMNTNDTQPLQTPQRIQRNYDPPPLPSENSTHLLKLHLNKVHLIQSSNKRTHFNEIKVSNSYPFKTIYSDETIYSNSIFNITKN